MQLMLALDSCIGDEVWPHICVEDCYRFVCVSNLCLAQFHLGVRIVLKFQFLSKSKFGCRRLTLFT